VAAQKYCSVASAINIRGGQVTNKAVAETFGFEYVPIKCGKE